MTDLNKIRNVARDSERQVDRAKSELNGVNNGFRNLGTAFTANPLFSREYSNLTNAIREAERALEKVKTAAKDVGRAAR